MSHFLFHPPILDSTEAGAFLFCDFTEYCPRGEKKFAPFSYVYFSGGSLQCFWCTWTCYECSNCTTCHRNVRHQSTGRNLHQHLCDESFTDMKIIAAFTKAPQWTYFLFCALWYIKTLVNTNKCTTLQSVYSFYYLYIKTLVNTNKCTTLQSVYSFYYLYIKTLVNTNKCTTLQSVYSFYYL